MPLRHVTKISQKTAFGPFPPWIVYQSSCYELWWSSRIFCTYGDFIGHYIYNSYSWIFAVLVEWLLLMEEILYPLFLSAFIRSRVWTQDFWSINTSIFKINEWNQWFFLGFLVFLVLAGFREEAALFSIGYFEETGVFPKATHMLDYSSPWLMKCGWPWFSLSDRHSTEIPSFDSPSV